MGIPAAVAAMLAAAAPAGEDAAALPGFDTSDPLADPAPARALPWVLLVALLLRVVAAWRNEVIFNDGPAFLQIAQRMQQGDWTGALSHAFHPLYPGLVWLVHGLGPGWELSAVACSVVAGVASVWALHVFLREAYGSEIAAIGAFLLAVNPYAVRFSVDVQSDTLYLAVFLASLAWLYTGMRDVRAGLAFVSGLFAGLAYLTRPEGVGPALAGGLLAGLAVLRGSWSPGQGLRFLAALGAGFLTTAWPYAAALRVLGGAWSLTNKKSLLELAGLGRGPIDPEYALRLGQTDLPLWSLLLAGCAVLAGGALASRSRRVGRGMLAAGCALLVVAAVALAPAESAVLAGVAVSTLRPESWLLLALALRVGAREAPGLRTLLVSTVMLLYAGVLFALLLAYGYLSRRHALPPLVLLLGSVAAGVIELARRLGSFSLRTAGARRSRGFWIGLVLAGLTVLAVPKALRDHRSEEVAGKRAAQWLQSRAQPAAALAASRSKLGYYAALEWRPLYAQDDMRPLPVLQQEGVRYLIVEGEVAAQPGGGLLRELHRESANGRVAVVFELVPGSGPGDS